MAEVIRIVSAGVIEDRVGTGGRRWARVAQGAATRGRCPAHDGFPQTSGSRLTDSTVTAAPAQRPRCR